MSFQRKKGNKTTRTEKFSARNICRLFFSTVLSYQNRRSPPEWHTVTEHPAHSVFYSILLFILRNISTLVKRNPVPPREFLCRKTKLTLSVCSLRSHPAAPPFGFAIFPRPGEVRPERGSFFCSFPQRQKALPSGELAHPPGVA